MTEVRFWFSYFRLGLERGATAKEALDVIVALLEEHGQGGNYYEDADSYHSFQSAYLIVDSEEAWVLETVGKYWAAERITGEWGGRWRVSRTGKAEAMVPGLREVMLLLQTLCASCVGSGVPLISGLLLLERNGGFLSLE